MFLQSIPVTKPPAAHAHSNPAESLFLRRLAWAATGSRHTGWLYPRFFANSAAHMSR